MTGRKVGYKPYLLLPVLVFALAFALVGTARAGDPADQFELDGNYPHDGGLQPYDWGNISPLSFADASGVKETIVEPGTSLFGTYPYPTKADQNAPNKADLTGAWLSSIADGDSLYLYLAAQRASSQQGTDPGGNTSAIFALHRDASVLNEGDMMVVMDFVNGGTTFVPTVLRYNGATWIDLGLSPTVATSIANVEGAIGPNGQPMPANTFVEAGIHLTDTDLLNAGSCLNATQLWIMTSSSQSNTSSLQDVLNGGRIDLNNSGVPVTNCGDVSVTKVVEGDAPDSTWEISISPNVDNFTSQVIGHGQTTTDVQINPNTSVTVTETSVQGLEFTATWSCSDGTSGDGSSFQVTAGAFEHIDCTITNVVDELPAVTVTKTAGSATVPQTGGNVTYTFVVTNSGGVPVEITVLKDDKFDTLEGDPDCTVGTSLAAGASCEFERTFPLDPAAPGATHTNVFTATVEDDQDNPASDTDDATVTYTDIPPKVSVNKVASPDEVLETGGDVTFTFTVTNIGTVLATIISLQDNQLGTLAGDENCEVGTVLAPGASCDFEETVPIPAGSLGQSHVNVFTATVEDEDGNEDSDSIEETVDYTDVPPMVNVVKTANPTSVPQTGGNVTFTYVVENTGRVAATITLLTDDKFDTLEGDADCEVGTVLAAGASCEFSEVFEVPAGPVGDSHVNVFTATLTDGDQNEDSDTDHAEVSYYADVPATITMTKTPSPSSVTAPGANVTYTVVVTNTSDVDTVVITSLVDDKFGDLGGQGTCSVEQTLDPGESYNCVFTGSVTGSAGTTHVNIVKADGYATDNEQPVSANATATVTITAEPPTPPPPPPPPPEEPTPTPTPSPTPTVEVLGSTAQIEKVLTSADPAVVGEQVTFRVRLTITGDTDVTQVVLVDTFENEYLEFVSSSGLCELAPNFPDAAHSSLGCEVGTVSPRTADAPGTKVIEYHLVFKALKSTVPDRTVNEVFAALDLDGDGPGALAEIGPAADDVEIIEILGVQLPPTGDGSTEDSGNSWMILAVLFGAASLGGVSMVVWSRERLR